MYDTSEGEFKEKREQMISSKYEREYDFLDVQYIQDNVYVTITATN